MTGAIGTTRESAAQPDLMSKAHPELTALASRGGVYLGLRYGLGALIGFANMFVLTRWIGPHAYGLFVTALGLTSFLATLTRAGIDTYLVRAESDPDERTYYVASTLILGFSLVLVGCAGAAVPLLIAWFGNREFLPVYLVALLSVPLAGLAGPATAKLERELNFRAVAGIELGGQTLALLVSVILAVRGLGVWAPVAGLLAWQSWAAAGALTKAKLVPRPAFDLTEARRMLSFGIGYSAALRVWQLRTLVNPLLVGRFVGPEGTAFVALSIRIAEGLGFVRVAAGRVAIAALSHLRDDRTRFQSVLENGLKLQLLALGPLLCLFALAAPAVVPRLLGARWTPSLWIYPFVAAGVLVNSLYNLQASGLFVAGKQWVVFRAYTAHVLVLGIGALVFVPWLGIVGYGWAELIACGAYAILHAGARAVAPLRYGKLGLLTCAFLLPPFALLLQQRWRAVLWTPLIVLTCAELWKRGSRFRRSAVKGPTQEFVPFLP